MALLADHLDCKETIAMNQIANDQCVLVERIAARIANAIASQYGHASPDPDDWPQRPAMPSRDWCREQARLMIGDLGIGIASAPEDVAWLTSEVERLRKGLAKLDDALDRFADAYLDHECIAMGPSAEERATWDALCQAWGEATADLDRALLDGEVEGK